MHLEAGLLAQQALSLAETELQLGASTTVFEWSRRAAVEARNWAGDAAQRLQEGLWDRQTQSERCRSGSIAGTTTWPSPPPPSPTACRPRRFPSRRGRAGPRRTTPNCSSCSAAPAESLAQEELLQHREEEARRLRDGAARALREALTLDPSAEEARLHLGRLLVVEGRLRRG